MLTINNELVHTYEKLVYSIIKKYSTSYNKDDLFQVGMLGVLDASKKYDPSSGVKFSSFAYKYILGEVLKYLREDRNIKISRDLISDYRKIYLAKERAYKTLGRSLSDTELSRILNMSKERISEAIKYNEKELSLNNTISDDEKLTLEDTIKKEEDLEAEDLINLKDAYENLSEDEKIIIYKRYFENKTQTELAKETNMSQVKVYRLERKILDKMKDKMS